ncbi:MAG: Phosphatidylinositol 4-kinase pik1alpha (PI4-kinase)(PtdIns-4-kinase) [Claussenomyces sp. TS43310]|nr:MAG: Phosphatidylinositol 4-kinase pik1alpha (PI4-kinase)(PtdIns-4-kinase) [Claussenomyces sp. TS43310]
MSWDLLKRFIESDVFNQNPFLSVAYLSRYADHVGIHYVLCSKLRQFSYEEIEFFLPQLCHLIISVDNESMALEEFILDLCEESVNGALLTFWLFQTYLHDLSNKPQAPAFKTCRRIYNKVQHIVFGVSDPIGQERIKENVLPVTVLASFVLASIAVPFLPQWAGPLAIAQARKPQSADDVISDTSQTQKLTRSRTVASPGARTRRNKEATRTVSTAESKSGRFDSQSRSQRDTSPPRPQSSGLDSKTSSRLQRSSHIASLGLDAQRSSASLPLPELKSPRPITRPPTPSSAGHPHRPTDLTRRRHTHTAKPISPSVLTTEQKSKLLRQNYFRSETQFLTALEDISNRLVLVPKPARLSALRAELALIAQDLPAEVDIPVICPATLVDGVPSNSKHHRIVRLNPAECTVLNSAEKVPYLLMVEILRDDFSFNPETHENELLVAKLIAEQGTSHRRIFDLSESPRHVHHDARGVVAPVDSVFEPISGDLGNSPLLTPTTDDDRPTESRKVSQGPQQSNGSQLSDLSSLTTPRTSIVSNSHSSSPGSMRRMTLPPSIRTTAPDQPDFSALATHMRTASQMLTQLELTNGKRPKGEVAAIRAKIIASMQSLEEQSFESSETPSFDVIMANANAAAVNVDPDIVEDDNSLDGPLNTGAGAARMENDQKTGGVQRKGDRDDPSAATFGEAWAMKKDRIRKASPYGWMKNWDLISVIVKTGADLRQEAFAVQLIRVCESIWENAGTPVWVKQMRILVTGESSGLIETIANGVSLHSLKRSLTLATIEAGQNPKRRIATLKDHFVKTFGAPETEPYKVAEDNFRRSLAAYSMISYIIQLKDRHNGNVLIDNEGHIVHIDFGFMLSNSPGSVGFEAAPFKLTQDYVDVLGGPTSESFEKFRTLCKQAFQALRRSADSVIDLVSMMGRDSKMPCFASGVQQTTLLLRQRFQLQLSAEEAEQFVETDLIGKSLGSYYTRLYDTFQYRTQGIY